MLHMKAAAVLLHCVLASPAPQCDDTTSLMQTSSFLRIRTAQPYGVADPRLQAPAEGGPFSKFYNERLQGHGIHKWLQYFPAYMRHFQQFIGKEVHIMEIGIQSGGSLDMWKSVFGPNAHVYGADIEAKTKLYEVDGKRIFIGDQADPKFWENIKKEIPRLDILIDDGGHLPSQQTGTLGMMLEHLSPNGIYITEDVHGQDNAFWHALKLNQLDTEPFHFKDLGKLVNSVHVYPFLLVIERAGNSGKDAMFRQLGLKSTADVPAEVKTIVSGAQPPEQSCMQMTLEGIFGKSLDFKASENVQNGGCVPHVRDEEDLSPILMQLPPKGWLVARDGGSDESNQDDKWDDKTDTFMAKNINDFKMMHEGNCCNWNANLMQQSVDSLHFYPHLLIAQRTSNDGNRLVKAPPHGTLWIPDVTPYKAAATATGLIPQAAEAAAEAAAINAAPAKGI